MNELDVELESEADEGLPGWVMTFADLMTLLMCFFVLLLAFSEMDVLRFKVLSGSVREAFGVQSEVEARTIPKGTSIIAREFSPGIPEPTALNTIRQFTTDSTSNSLDFESDDEASEYRRRIDRLRALARKIAESLSKEIEAGDVAVRMEEQRVVIQLQEKATFRSGYADLATEFVPTLTRLRDLLRDTAGTIVVSGHTDDVPISNDRFGSNWDLSSARAVSVLHILEANGDIAPSRLLLTAHAATQPLLPNDSSDNRAANRRVEISILQEGVRRSGTDTAIRTDDDAAAPTEIQS